jgi:2-polyprenyl-3-methyl-5-hydroxy-6-metoxy-1,4-benzoquinol methylase
LHENAYVEREDWNRKHGEAGLLFGAEPNRFLVTEVASLSPGRALDLACGSGRNAVWLAAQGWTVTGVDFSEVALAQARALAADRGVEVEWVEGDLLEWRSAERAYDLVVVLYLQLPAEERRAVLAHAAAAVASGGTLLIVGHDLENLDGGHGGPKDPRVLFTAAEVAAELPGLEIEKAERVLRTVETEDGEAQAIDALIRARR